MTRKEAIRLLQAAEDGKMLQVYSDLLGWQDAPSGGMHWEGYAWRVKPEPFTKDWEGHLERAMKPRESFFANLKRRWLIYKFNRSHS